MKKNLRGFSEYGSIMDERGVRVRVTESSLATARRIWVFVDDSESIYTDKTNKEVALHLSAAEIKKLISILQASLKNHRFD